MAFPQTSAPTETAFSSTTTAHAVSMPATVNSGDLLRTLFFIQNAVTTTVTTPTGWSVLWDSDADIAAPFRGASYVRVADGTEDGTTVDFVTSDADTAAAMVHRVTNWYGSLAGVEAGGFAQVNASSAPNSGSLSPSWGSDDNLWFSEGGARDDDESVSTYPSGFTNGADVVSGGGVNNGCEVFSANIEASGVSFLDPGAYALTGSDAWAAATVAVRPAGTAHTSAGAVVLRPVAIAASAASTVHTGSGAVSARPVAIAAVASQAHTASGAVSTLATTMAGSASISYMSDGTVTLSPVAMSAAANSAVAAAGAGAVSITPTTLSATAALSHLSSAAIALASYSMVGNAYQAQVSSGAVSLAAVIIAGSAIAYGPFLGASSLALAAVVLQAAGEEEVAAQTVLQLHRIVVDAIGLGAANPAGVGSVETVAIILSAAAGVPELPTSVVPVIISTLVRGLVSNLHRPVIREE